MEELTNQTEPAAHKVGYKGFDLKFQCRSYQYEVGCTYEHEGAVEACSSGFHACEYPLDVFSYYEPANSVFARVNLSGKMHSDGGDSKIAAARIEIVLQVKLHELVAAAVDWIMARIKHNGEPQANLTEDSSLAANTGHRSAATNTGHSSAATNTGYSSAATNTGYSSAARVDGKHSVAVASGFYGRARAVEGSAIVLVTRKECSGEILHIRAGIAGRDGVKADTWYSLDADGNFEEVAE